MEIEVNGLMTYDRAVIKMDVDRIAAAARRLYLPPPVRQDVVPTSEQSPQTWRYTTDKPAGDWFKPGFDDSSGSGPAGFGTEHARRRRAHPVEDARTSGSAARSSWSEVPART